MTKTMSYDVTEAQDFFNRKLAFTTGPIEVSHQLADGEDLNIIDVREPEDFKAGHVPGAKNLPKAEWSSPDCLRTDAINLIYCYTPTCHLGAQAAARFASKGYPVMEMDGGFEAWRENELTIES